MSWLPFNPYRKQLALTTLVTWMVLWGLVMIVPPAFVKDVGWRSSYLPFFGLVLSGLYLGMWTVTGRWKRSGLRSLVVTVGLCLRVYQLDSAINLILLISFGGIWEYYWHISTDST